MIPAANLIGFAGQELARKLPKVFGIVLETTLGSIVEIVLFMILLKHGFFQVIQSAILGSILANLLLCLGLCFFIGGLTMHEQEFDEAVSEVGSGLLLVAGLGLLVPTAFKTALQNNNVPDLENHALMISRITAILLLVSFLV
jgi:Ca2+:H+ antiporter